MLFVFIHVYWCPTRFPFHMMSVSLKSYRTGQVSLSEQVMFVLFKSYRTGQVSLSEQVMFVSFKSYRTGQVPLSVQVMLVSFKSYRTDQVSEQELLIIPEHNFELLLCSVTRGLF